MPLGPINEYNSQELLYIIAQNVSPMALLPIEHYNSHELLYIIASNIGGGGGGGGVDATAIARDGSRAPVANIGWNNKRIINLADPTDDQDAATLAKVKELVAGKWSFFDQYDPTVTGLFPTAGSLPSGGVAAGDAFEISESGVCAGILLFKGDIVIAKYDEANPSDPIRWLIISSGSDYNGLQQLYAPGNYISTPTKDNAQLSFGTVGRILQGLLIEIPFKSHINNFLARTNTTVGGTPLAQFALYQITNLKTFALEQVAKSSSFNSNGSVLHTIHPGSSVIAESGWYMLFLERNADAAAQAWLQYTNNSIIPRVGWDPSAINAGGMARAGAENLAGWSYSGNLPTTLTIGTDFGFTVTSNVIAYWLDITPL